MKKVCTNKRGFTLTELLVVIAILAVVLLIAVPTASNYINNSKKKAFFVSVSNIVNAIKPEQILNQTDTCIYNYSTDKENQNENIKTLYVLAHKDSELDKVVYSVFASMDGVSTAIDIYDFSSLNTNNVEQWVQKETTNKSYTYYATSLLVESSKQEELFSYKNCELK